AQVQIAGLLRGQGKYREAAEACFAALAILPRWPDAYFGLAAAYYFLEEWDKVLHWVEVGRSLPAPDTLLFVNVRAYTFDWIIYSTNALYRLARVTDALEWTRVALAIEPDDPWHQHNARWFAAQLAS